jgi:hypothetical protein
VVITPLWNDIGLRFIQKHLKAFKSSIRVKTEENRMKNNVVDNKFIRWNNTESTKKIAPFCSRKTLFTTGSFFVVVKLTK